MRGYRDTHTPTHRWARETAELYLLARETVKSLRWVAHRLIGFDTHRGLGKSSKKLVSVPAAMKERVLEEDYGASQGSARVSSQVGQETEDLIYF